MKHKIIEKFVGWSVLILLLSASLSCEKEPQPKPQGPEIPVLPSVEADHAVILYSAGFNDLSQSLENNIDTLKKGFIPGMHDPNMLFIFSHNTTGYRNYRNKTTPILKRLYINDDNELVEEIVLRLLTDTRMTDPSVLNAVLTHIDQTYRIGSYGLIFSSHSSGYLPKYYLNNEYSFEKERSIDFTQTLRTLPKQPLFLDDYPYNDDGTLRYPMTKSLGAHGDPWRPEEVTYDELDFINFCESLPLHFDYILFDSCLMGGIEVVYELKDKCDIVGASPTEVMASGLNYTNMIHHIFNSSSHGLIDISGDYMAQYKDPKQPYPYATWTLVDTKNLDLLAKKCKELFRKYKEQISKIDPDEVQGFFYRDNRHFHYDFMDIIRQFADPAELAGIEDALDACIIFEDHTDYFLGCRINTCSGLSMMLPSDAKNYLKNYYRNLAWNKATDLVK